MVDHGRVSSTLPVYEELIVGQDELADWARARRSSGLFPEPDAAVQNSFRSIAEYAARTYSTSESSRFLREADP